MKTLCYRDPENRLWSATPIEKLYGRMWRCRREDGVIVTVHELEFRKALAEQQRHTVTITVG